VLAVITSEVSPVGAGLASAVAVGVALGVNVGVRVGASVAVRVGAGETEGVELGAGVAEGVPVGSLTGRLPMARSCGRAVGSVAVVGPVGTPRA